MRRLTTREEIAEEVNVKRTTVVRIDLADSDWLGIKSQKIMIEAGSINGEPYLIPAEIKAYSDEMKFTFSSSCYGSIIKREFGYQDWEEMIEFANAPVVKRDSDVVMIVVDSMNEIVVGAVVLHTDKIVYPNCGTTLKFIDEDNNAEPFMEFCPKKELLDEWQEDRSRWLNKNRK